MKWTEKRHYDVLERGYWKNLHAVRIRWILGRLEAETARLGRPLRILDVGCGDAVITRYMREAFPDARVDAVDLDDVRLRRATAYCPGVAFVQGDVTRLPWRSGAHDVVVCHHVVEHIPEYAEVLAECRRALAPGGLLVLGIPQEDGAIGRWVRWLHRGLYERGEHVNFFTIGSMRARLAAAGFGEIEHAKFGLLFPQYHLHVLLVWNAITFAIGHWISQRFDATADSLIFAARPGAAPATPR